MNLEYGKYVKLKYKFFCYTEIAKLIIKLHAHKNDLIEQNFAILLTEMC